jgi:hypothetical protein
LNFEGLTPSSTQLYFHRAVVVLLLLISPTSAAEIPHNADPVANAASVGNRPTLAASATSTALTSQLHHLRIDGSREWSEFPEQAELAALELKFQSAKNGAEQTLVLRQQDVKQAWPVKLNGKTLGRLVVDENDMVVTFSIPPGTLRDGDNTLQIVQEPRAKMTDDIRVGEIVLHARPPQEVLAEGRVEIDVQDAADGMPLPARITIINQAGALQTVGAKSNEHLAVRPGIVYSGNGHAEFGLPTGRYTIFAGRGFEYSLDSATIEVTTGGTVRKMLKIRREVPTEGYVACDTHVHTLTFSGHGDATAEERMITLAAEGIELPIATDHNKHIDHEPLARKMGLRRYFTPVVGNEVTTTVGHFNVFPARADAPVPNHRPKEWSAIFDNIYRTPDVKVVILNHARDLHSGVRPFGPDRYNALVGANLDGWVLRANGMEVINSGAVQTDVMRLFRDWMGMLNGGRVLTPVAASDSHDVGRHFVGQGRTYIRARDDDPGNINVDEAVAGFLAGRVMVSYGLLTELTIDGRFGPGELAPVTGEQVRVDVRILGPHWARANRLKVFANGQPIRDISIPESSPADRRPGVIWSDTWTMPTPKHDVHLVAIASGPGIDGLYWKTAKPYQPTSPDWTASVLGASGAVWLDADGDGRRTPAVDYARRVVSEHRADWPALYNALADYDSAVAAQAAHLCQQAGRSLLDAAAQSALKEARPEVQRGMTAYLEAWRENQVARGVAP